MAAGKAKKARREETLIVKLTAEEKKMVQKIAREQGGKSVSEWVRERIWNATAGEAAEIYSSAVAQEIIDRHKEKRWSDITDKQGMIPPGAIKPTQQAYEKVVADLVAQVKHEIDAYLAEKQPKGKKTKGKG